MQNLVILGSTGSIGTSTLDVVRLNLDKYKVFALSANNNHEKLFNQCIEFNPVYAIIPNPELAKLLSDKLHKHNCLTEVLSQFTDLSKVVSLSEVDLVMSSLVGSIGLIPTLDAVKAGKKVLLANKESMIVGGRLIQDAITKFGGKIIPVDSEHSAIFQCLESNDTHPQLDGVNKLILTASGGPFRTFSYEEISKVTSTQALKHPNWVMGAKVTIDSSTLMNKGLEVIEAHWLFGMPVDKIEVIIHPQSVIHSMVEYIDGSVLAQLGTPDMKVPIAYALSYPQRIISGANKLDFTTLKDLTFEKPDYVRFPALKLAYQSLKAGGIAPTILNGANEIAVDLFMQGRLSFYGISDLVSRSLDHFGSSNFADVEELLDYDAKVRSYAQSIIA